MIGLKILILRMGVGLLLALCSLGCSNVSFEGSQADGSNSETDTPISEGTIKNSYFFVKRAADILFVIDNSGSMAEEQDLLKVGFPSFTSTINSYSGGTLDWHIAITSTDVFNSGIGTKGSLVPFSGLPAGTFFLNPSINIAQANAAFQATVTLGTANSGDERGIAAARLLAQREYDSSTSVGFLRPDTSLSVIVLSDEDERSTRDTSSSQYQPFEPIDEPANFASGIRALDTHSTGEKTITFHSIVTSTKACLDGAGESMGTTYVQLSSLTGGIVGDICALNESYQQQLESLAVNIVNEAKTYTMACKKVKEGTVEIYEQSLGGALELVPSTFLPPNKVTLKTAPAVGSLIKAHFLCLD